MRLRRTRAAIGIAILAAVVPASASATFPGATGLVAFQSDRDGDFGIWTSNADASNPQPLYDQPGSHEFNPAWSPSGTHVVLQTGPLDRSTFDLVIVEVATGEATPLLASGTNDHAAQFCDPDTIVFTRQTDPANSDIWSIDTDGTNLQQLTDAPGRQSFPTCSPDSTRIAYITNQTGPPAIWEMNTDGSGQHELVPGPALDPDYTPDREGLTYAGPDPADGNLEIFELYLDSGETEQLTHTPPPNQSRLPHYAPDYPNGTVEVYFTRLDPGLDFPETNLALLGDPAGDPTAFCGNPPPGPPGAPPNPPPGDPGGPKNNSAIAAQPTVGCRLSSDGDLTIEGTEGPDTIRVYRLDNGDIGVDTNGQKTSYRAATVKRITILGKGGDDDIDTRLDLPITADGGPGIDIVDGVVTIEGTPNPDRVEIDTEHTGADEGTVVRLNGRELVFEPGVLVDLVGFDAKDTVVTDRQSAVRINGFIRILPEVFMSRANPIIQVTGTPENDRISIKLDRSATFRISLNGQQAPGITGIFGLVRTDVAGRGGDDTIDTNINYNRLNRLGARPLGGPPMPVRVEGGPGADRVTCRGAAQTCTVIAGTGNDRVDVRDRTRSVVDGGPGSDRVVADRADSVRRAEIVVRG